MKRIHLALRLFLSASMVFVIHDSCCAQVVFASRPLLPQELDEVVSVTDWQDSVFVVLKGGAVIAYDTLFTQPRIVREVINLRIHAAWVHDGALFLDDQSTGVYVFTENGGNQFIDLGQHHYVGYDHLMKPYFVMQEVTLTIQKNVSGFFDVVRHTIQVPYSSDIAQLVFFRSCVYVSKSDKQSQVLYSDGSSVESQPRRLSAHSAYAIHDSILMIAEWAERVMYSSNLCQNPDSLILLDFQQSNPFVMNGSTQRTTPNAPFALFYGEWRKGTSRLVVWWHDRGLDTSYNSLITERQRSASTTDRAVYLYEHDGKVIRISLSSRRVTVRTTGICSGCMITSTIPFVKSSRSETGLIERNDRWDTLGIVIANEESGVRRIVYEHPQLGIVSQSSDFRLFHVFPNGDEFIDVTTRSATRKRLGQWNVRDRRSLERPQALDSATVFVHGGFVRYQPDADSIVVQTVTQLLPSAIHAGSKKHYFFSYRDTLFYARRDDWGDTLRFETMSLRGQLYGVSNEDPLLVRLYSRPEFGAGIDSMLVYRVNIENRTVDSTMIVLPSVLQHQSKTLVILDTIRIISAEQRMVATVLHDGSLRFDTITHLPEVTRFFGQGLFSFKPPSMLYMSDAGNRRTYSMYFGSEPPTVNVRESTMLDVEPQHIFLLDIYPNPVTSTATLEMRRHKSSESYTTELYLVDLEGKKVRDYSSLADVRFTVGTVGRTILDFSGIPAGPYLLILRNAGVVSSKLVVVSR